MPVKKKYCIETKLVNQNVPKYHTHKANKGHAYKYSCVCSLKIVYNTIM